MSSRNDVRLDQIPRVYDSPYVFPMNMPRLSIEREVDFTIELALKSNPILKASFRRTTLKLTVLKVFL